MKRDTLRAQGFGQQVAMAQEFAEVIGLEPDSVQIEKFLDTVLITVRSQEMSPSTAKFITEKLHEEFELPIGKGSFIKLYVGSKLLHKLQITEGSASTEYLNWEV